MVNQSIKDSSYFGYRVEMDAPRGLTYTIYVAILHIIKFTFFLLHIKIGMKIVSLSLAENRNVKSK